MKNIISFLSVFSLIFLVSCGGSGGGGSTAAQEAERSFDVFNNQASTCFPNASFGSSVTKQFVDSCDCNVSGTVTMTISNDEQDMTMDADMCVPQSGYTYNGTLSATGGSTAVTGTMDRFGECTNAIINVDISETFNCIGDVQMSCPSGNVDCDVVDSTTDPDTCDLRC